MTAFDVCERVFDRSDDIIRRWQSRESGKSVCCVVVHNSDAESSSNVIAFRVFLVEIQLLHFVIAFRIFLDEVQLLKFVVAF